MQSTLFPDEPASAPAGACRALWPEFPASGTHLQRYGARFNAVETNSPFYRPHQSATYARWAASVRKHFRYSVKLPRAISHQQRLASCTGLLADFLEQARRPGLLAPAQLAAQVPLGL